MAASGPQEVREGRVLLYNTSVQCLYTLIQYCTVQCLLLGRTLEHCLNTAAMWSFLQVWGVSHAGQSGLKMAAGLGSLGHCTVGYCRVLHSTLLHFLVLHCTLLYSNSVLDCTVIYCITQHCTLLQCNLVNFWWRQETVSWEEVWFLWFSDFLTFQIPSFHVEQFIGCTKAPKDQIKGGMYLPRRASQMWHCEKAASLSEKRPTGCV